MRQVVKFTETSYVGLPDPQYYRIEFDNVTRQVRVRPHSAAIAGIREQHEAEKSENVFGRSVNTVFVSADKIADLKDAYPNYFGDVQLFAKNLKDITLGKSAREYTMPPQERVPPPPHDAKDLSWFRARKRWK